MKKRRWIFAVLTVLWIAFIFYNSAQSAAVSSSLSEGVVSILGLEISQFWVRKAAHFMLFFILGVLLSGALYEKKELPLGWALLLVLAVACIDETIQLFPVGRSSELRDVWIDFSGGALSTIAIKLFLKKRAR